MKNGVVQFSILNVDFVKFENKRIKLFVFFVKVLKLGDAIED